MVWIRLMLIRSMVCSSIKVFISVPNPNNRNDKVLFIRRRGEVVKKLEGRSGKILINSFEFSQNSAPNSRSVALGLMFFSSLLILALNLRISSLQDLKSLFYLCQLQSASLAIDKPHDTCCFNRSEFTLTDSCEYATNGIIN